MWPVPPWAGECCTSDRLLPSDAKLVRLRALAGMAIGPKDSQYFLVISRNVNEFFTSRPVKTGELDHARDCR